MIDLKFGDICIADLSRSLSSPKTITAPVIYLSAKDDGDVRTFRFCRVGKMPNGYTTKPFIMIGKHPYLRDGSAIYPTQTVLFTDESAILFKAGTVDDEHIEQEIYRILQQAKRKEHQAIIMALCSRCRREFLMNPETVVKRLDPFSVQEYQCDFCQTRTGHTYVIYKRRLYGGNK